MQAAPEATEETDPGYIKALHKEIDRLWLENQRLKGNQSFGYVRGRGMNAPDLSMKIDTLKPRVEAIDIPPVTAQLPDD